MSIQAINVRNQFKGKVREIIRGDVVSEVDVETAWGIVTSVITTRSVKELHLKAGPRSHCAGEVDRGVDRRSVNRFEALAAHTPWPSKATPFAC